MGIICKDVTSCYLKYRRIAYGITKRYNASQGTDEFTGFSTQFQPWKADNESEVVRNPPPTPASALEVLITAFEIETCL